MRSATARVTGSPSIDKVRLAGEIERIVLARISEGRLTIPASPAVAARCLAILRDPNGNHRKLVQVVESDPILTAMVMRGANCAAHGAMVNTTELAVARLGQQKLKTTVLEFAARELFQSPDRQIAATCRKIWTHSVAVALLSRDLAGLVGNPDSDGCYVAGLLHDVGKPVMAAMLLEAEAKLAKGTTGWLDAALWSRTVEDAHRQVGLALALEWKLPDEVVAAIRDCGDYDATNRSSSANVVRFANALAKREGFATVEVDTAEVEAMIVVGTQMLGGDETVIGRVVTGLADRVAQQLL